LWRRREGKGKVMVMVEAMVMVERVGNEWE
jgi:hypothetical protein